jgi:hypothetical protein
MVLPLIPIAIGTAGIITGGVLGFGLKKPEEITQNTNQFTTNYQQSIQTQNFLFESGSNVEDIVIGQESNQSSDQKPIQTTERTQGLLTENTLKFALVGVAGYFILKGVGVLK